MSKWKCGICGSEFDNFQAQGFEGTIYCPLCYFKKLYKDIELEREKLQSQLQQKENIIKEVREKLKELKTDSQEVENEWAVDICDIVLEILDKENK